MAEPAPLPPDTADQNRGPTMLAVSYPVTALASLFVAGRLFSRRRKLGRWETGDYIILVSLGLVYLCVGFLTAAIALGGGRHGATLPPPEFELASLLTLVGLTMGALSFTLTKVAVVLLVIKLLRPSPWHVRLLWSLVIGGVLFMIAAGLVYFLQCSPPQALWIMAIAHKCSDPVVSDSLAIGASAFSALSDFYLALYPAVVLWSLDMNQRKKLALSVALGFGACAGAVSVYKCTTVSSLSNKIDFTYAATRVVIWTIVEANCVIIAACIPMLMPLLELWFGRNFLSGQPLRLPSLSFSFGVGGTSRKPDQTSDNRYENRAV